MAFAGRFQLIGDFPDCINSEFLHLFGSLTGDRDDLILNFLHLLHIIHNEPTDLFLRFLDRLCQTTKFWVFTYKIIHVFSNWAA